MKIPAIIFLLISTSIINCKTSQTDTIKSEETSFQTTQVSLDQEDCYPDREVVKKLADVEGTIIKVADTFCISVGDSDRYQPCNLPEALHTADMKVIFSGKVKEIFDRERRIGTPLVLSSILPR